ncbi:PKD domain-containing protein, partial [candidate division KSB1 bacterium]|nr:PKD domain-containing protein [candidate division KSB1 bacterium]
MTFLSNFKIFRSFSTVFFVTLQLLVFGYSTISAADILSGRVYEGEKLVEPPASKALFNVLVMLYGSNDMGNVGVLIDSTRTDNQGWYGLTVTEGFEFYTIEEVDPWTHYSVWASSVSGKVITYNRIRYSTETAPISQQTLTGNKFWDKLKEPENNPPVADADGPYSGMTGQPVTLDGSGSYDPDTGDSIVKYEWDLDSDGQYDDATGMYPLYTWSAPTIAIIWLKVTDSHGESDTDSTTVRITQQPVECNAEFSASPRSGCAPLSVNFTDQSTNPQSWYWKFPGGTPATSTQQNPTVVYSTPGSYSVSLRIVCTTGQVDSVIKVNYIQADYCPAQCEADFDASPRSGCAPLSVNFTDQSTNPQSWYWNFPGGTPATSTQQNPTVVYSTPGLYSVSLRIVCTTGQVDSVIKVNYIQADYCPQPCNAEFSASPRSGCAPLSVNFTDQSTNPQSWYWNFPGGTPATSTQQNPTVVYSTPGLYSVSLRIVCTTGQVDSVYKIDYIEALECAEGIDYGDAPDPTYPTLLVNNGARHIIEQGFHLGVSIDAETDGQPTPLSDGDDVNATNDEDGVIMSPFIAPGQSVPITIIASDTGVVNAWFDFN